MVGSNKIVLNLGTVIEAIQEYLDKRFSEGAEAGPRVQDIQQVMNMQYPGTAAAPFTHLVVEVVSVHKEPK